MAMLIGTDEAGYGPNLGPLTIGGSVWRVPDSNADLYDVLEAVVDRGDVDNKIQVADSKSVYRSAIGLASLERPVLAMLAAIHGAVPADWLELARWLGFDGVLRTGDPVFDESRNRRLPVAADSLDVLESSERLTHELERQSVEMRAVQVRMILPDEFNRRVDELGNKAELLSLATFELIDNLIEAHDLGDDELRIGCDKHGGRSRYAAMIQHVLTDELVQIHEESLERSRYTWTDIHQAREIEFRARGESFFPIAVASMMAKYVRQVAMELWNEFWLAEIPRLRPTQGYPRDAKRFKSEIASTMRRMNIAENEIWRCR